MKVVVGTYQVLRDVDFHRLVGEPEHRDDLAHPVGAVVEEEQGVALCAWG